MSNYRRIKRKGGTYFFTVNLARRPSNLLADRVDQLRCAYASTVRDLPVYSHAVVILPDHLHVVWTLPPLDADYSERWRLIKYRFSQKLGIHLPRSASKRRKRETGVWQRRFWEHTIRDEADLRNHIHYCWGNPVKHGLTTRAADWPFSSIHRDIRLGRVDAGWNQKPLDGKYGE